ncbi:MAG: histidinol-phosphatase HisJ family protein [Planctomycetota bacterium]
MYPPPDDKKTPPAPKTPEAKSNPTDADTAAPRSLTFWDATPNPRGEGPTSPVPDDTPTLKFQPASDDGLTTGPGLSLTFSEAGEDAAGREGNTTTSRPRRAGATLGLYESHMHTALCKHAKGGIEQYAHVAEQRGLAGVIVTCHNPMPDGYAAPMRMDEAQLDEYAMYVERARHVMEGRVDVRLGLEADYVPGYEKYVEHQLSLYDFDFVLGSVHPQVPEYQDKYYEKDTFKFQQLYFQHLADSAETGLFDSLAHPDLIKMLMPRRWSVSKILDDVCKSLDRIAATGVAMEFNTSGWRKPMAEPCPGPRILYEMARRRIPVTLGSDAHSPKRVGENFRKALRLIQAAGYRKVSVFQQRQRHDLDIGTAYRQLMPSLPTAVQPPASV